MTGNPFTDTTNGQPTKQQNGQPGQSLSDTETGQQNDRRNNQPNTSNTISAGSGNTDSTTTQSNGGGTTPGGNNQPATTPYSGTQQGGTPSGGGDTSNGNGSVGGRGTVPGRGNSGTRVSGKTAPTTASGGGTNPRYGESDIGVSYQTIWEATGRALAPYLTKPADDPAVRTFFGKGQFIDAVISEIVKENPQLAGRIDREKLRVPIMVATHYRARFKYQHPGVWGHGVGLLHNAFRTKSFRELYPFGPGGYEPPPQTSAAQPEEQKPNNNPSDQPPAQSTAQSTTQPRPYANFYTYAAERLSNSSGRGIDPADVYKFFTDTNIRDAYFGRLDPNTIKPEEFPLYDRIIDLAGARLGAMLDEKAKPGQPNAQAQQTVQGGFDWEKMIPMMLLLMLSNRSHQQENPFLQLMPFLLMQGESVRRQTP